jgi:hypothetical protein
LAQAAACASHRSPAVDRAWVSHRGSATSTRRSDALEAGVCLLPCDHISPIEADMPQDTHSPSPPFPARQPSWPALVGGTGVPPDRGQTRRARSSQLAGRRAPYRSTGGETRP